MATVKGLASEKRINIERVVLENLLKSKARNGSPNIEHNNLNSCDLESVLLTLCHIKIYIITKTRWNKVLYLYPKCTKLAYEHL